MTMENNELNNIVLNKVRNNIVISNLEREERMRVNKKKQVISLCVVAVVFLSGSFFTANAATEGKLVENIKQKCNEIVSIKYDESKLKLVENKEEKDHAEYRLETIDGESETIIVYMNKNNLETENATAEINLTEEGCELKITDNKN